MRNSLGWLEELYYLQGPSLASDAFKAQLAPSAVSGYSVLKSEEGQPTLRTDVNDKDGIEYESFNPPAFWEVPYNLLKATFSHTPKVDFMYHGGEEALIPLTGEIYYHFYTTFEAKRPHVKKVGPLRPGSIILLNPQMPHHTWGGPKGGQAWMIIRHVSDTASSISLNPSKTNVDPHPTPRRIDIRKLKEPGVYSLVAWGIAEKVRLVRDRTGYKVSQLARACGIDPSHWSRIENADTNVSLETLMRVSQFLGIGLDELICPSPWCYQTDKLPPIKQAKNVSSKPLNPEGWNHDLHMSCWNFPAGSAFSPRRASEKTSPPSSWVMLEGRAIFDISTNGKTEAEIMGVGGVLHFRHELPLRIQALEKTQLLKIVYSATTCVCGEK